MISEEQLKQWSCLHTLSNSNKTVYENVWKALTSEPLSLSLKEMTGEKFQVYIQGSFRNLTSILGESDIDIVVQISHVADHTYRQEKERLFSDWIVLRERMLDTLRNNFQPDKISEGDKTLKINDLFDTNVDVLPCFQHYTPSRFEGVLFFSKKDSQRMIVNYPKLHSKNGFRKNSRQRTKNQYKPIVRLFKNSRTFLEKERLLRKDLNSYFLENIIYNVPDRFFMEPYQRAYQEIVSYLLDSDLHDFQCQDEQDFLFTGTRERWDLDDAKELIEGLHRLWEGW